jgi:hypothetical protein
VRAGARSPTERRGLAAVLRKAEHAEYTSNPSPRRGFAFVEVSSEDEAQRAIRASDSGHVSYRIHYQTGPITDTECRAIGYTYICRPDL